MCMTAKASGLNLGGARPIQIQAPCQLMAIRETNSDHQRKTKVPRASKLVSDNAADFYCAALRIRSPADTQQLTSSQSYCNKDPHDLSPTRCSLPHLRNNLESRMKRLYRIRV
eukprot:2276384-Amphidinium_carterae.1